jgi:hypothetical protein
MPGFLRAMAEWSSTPLTARAFAMACSLAPFPTISTFIMFVHPFLDFRRVVAVSRGWEGKRFVAGAFQSS